MFDYNFLGIGYIYSDIMNVIWQMGEVAKKAFLNSYGPIDESQKFIYDVTSPLTNLIFAYQRNKFPAWAESSLAEVEDGTLYKKILKLVNSGF